MPELPDVEQFRRYFNATALYQRIRQIHVQGPELLVDTSPQGLGRALKDQRFESTARRGKYLFAGLDGGSWLVLHFGMSGRLHYAKSGDRPRYTQLSVEFENGSELDYVAPRKLGRIALADSPQDWSAARQLGPDALQIGEEDFLELAGGRRGQIKSWLMDQHSIAGIGNYYSDEILYQCRIHPKRKLDTLEKSDYRKIYRKMRSILETAIDKNAEPGELPNSFLLPQRRKGGHCPRCDTVLKTIEAAGRTAWYCPHCQAN